jgi:hypothetical protein
MAAAQRWCRVTVLGPGGTVRVHHILEGPAAPDIDSVDEVARLALWAGREGGSVVLSEVSPEFDELLELSGLRVEMGWQAEGCEETVVVEQVEEEAHPCDPPP